MTGVAGPRLDWDDLRYVLAVAREGSAGGAARSLNVAHATVLRRIQAIEHDLGMRVFERLPAGLALTDSARPLLDAAQSIDRTIIDARRQLAGRSAELEGPLRAAFARRRRGTCGSSAAENLSCAGRPQIPRLGQKSSLGMTIQTRIDWGDVPLAPSLLLRQHRALRLDYLQQFVP